MNLDELYKNSPELFPKTIAIAMDGNRRWTEKHNLKEIDGHRVSIENLNPLIKRAASLGVKSITFWLFSPENFKRNGSFLEGIFSLAREYLWNDKNFKEINDLGGKVSVVGNLSLFPEDIANKVFEYVSKSNPIDHKIDVVFALGYGGKDEIVRGIKKLIKEGVAAEHVTEDSFANYLDLKENIDLMIRTGGRKRTSGLYIWQAAYAELHFTDTLCPDFTAEELDKAILDFTNRTRNFGV